MHFCEQYDHADGVAKYLSRYVKSGPLKNKQIKSVTAEQVKYQYYSHQAKKTETLTLPTGQFIQRLLQHAPLPGKPTVRYSGLYHSATRKKLNLARAALGQPEVSERQILDWQQFMESKGTLPVCEQCGLKINQNGGDIIATTSGLKKWLKHDHLHRVERLCPKENNGAL